MFFRLFLFRITSDKVKKKKNGKILGTPIYLEHVSYHQNIGAYCKFQRICKHALIDSTGWNGWTGGGIYKIGQQARSGEG